jgi:hypothetical protein
MDAIAKSLAGKETGAIASPGGMPLDEYVQAAWSSAIAKSETKGKADGGDRTAEMAAEHAVLVSALPAADTLPLPKRLQALRNVHDVPAAADESTPQQAISPRAFRSKDEPQDNMPLAGFAPQPVLPMRPADLSWQPRRGVAAPTTSNTTIAAAPAAAPVAAPAAPNTSTAVTASISANVRITTERRSAASTTVAAAMPTTASTTAPTTVPTGVTTAAPATAALPAPAATPNKSSAAGKSPAAMQSATPASAKKVAPVMAGQSTEQAVSASSVQTEDALPTPLKEALPLEKKPSTQKKNRSSAIAEAPLQINTAQAPQALAQSTVLQEGATAQADRPKQAAQGAPMAAGVKADSAVSTGASLTYRFDKWNGNHAVTVHTAAPADLSAAAERGDMRAGAQTLTTSLPDAPVASQQAQLTQQTQQTLQSATQYTLSPSDQLVGQRLGEHLARFGADADLPQLHLKDADERQRQQQQAEQQDEEDEA